MQGWLGIAQRIGAWAVTLAMPVTTGEVPLKVNANPSSSEGLFTMMGTSFSITILICVALMIVTHAEASCGTPPVLPVSLKKKDPAPVQVSAAKAGALHPRATTKGNKAVNFFISFPFL